MIWRPANEARPSKMIPKKEVNSQSNIFSSEMRKVQQVGMLKALYVTEYF